MKKIYLIGLAFFCSILVLDAQRSITGTVTDENGESLIGAGVAVKGMQTGTITDFDGNFELEIANDAETLVFSYVGFQDMEVPVTSASVYNVSLISGVQLQETVVTAFGLEREKKALAYSVQEVGGDDLVKVGQANLTNALQGKIAGVQVNQSSGMPGASSFIRVRGSNSFNLSNEPLFVIDGMPVASSADGTGGVSGTDYSSRSLDINLEDVESISVLKGGAASALYGMRASNGVVLITTKRGSRKAGKPQITLSQTYNFDQVSRLPDLQSTYAQGAGGNFNPAASTSWGPRIDNLANPATNTRAVLDASGNPTGRYRNNIGEEVTPQTYDNVGPLFQDGHMSITNIGISGGIADRGNYIFNAGYTDQTGVIPTTGMEKWNFRLSGDYKLSDKWSTGANINFASTSIDKLAGGSNLSNVLFTTYWAPRSYDLWGTPFAAEDNPYAQIHYRGAMDNPRWSLANNSFAENITRSFGNAYIQYKPIEGMTIKYQAGLDAFTESNKEVYSLGSGFTGGRAGIRANTALVNPNSLPSGGQITDYTRTYQQFNSNFNIMYSKYIGDISLDFILGNEVIDIRSNALQVVGNGIQIGGFDNLNNTASQIPTQTSTHQRTIGNYANVNVGYKNFLYLNGSIRQDRVSNMPSDNRDFIYPSVGLGLVFTELMEPNRILNYGKIRASYAEVGQAGPLFVSATPFITAAAGTGFTNDGILFPFNGLAGFQESNTLRSLDLRPQNTVSLEFGVDLQFFNNRLGLDVTYFQDNTKDQIFSVPVASSTGYAAELRNAGEMLGTGWEAVLSVTPVVNSNFRWDFITNFTRVSNEVVSLADGVENIFLGGFVTPNVRAQAGSQYPIIFGSRYLRDAEDRIVYDGRQFIGGSPNPAYGMPVRNPVDSVIGNVNPRFEMGFINNFSYKNLTLTVQVDLRVGGQMWAGNTRLQKLYGMDAVTEDRDTPWVGDGVKGYFTTDPETGDVIVQSEGENDIAILRNQAYWSVYQDAIEESNVYSTSFLRLREVSLNYTFPKATANRMGMENFSVFVSGRNLLLLTEYPNFDPETSVGGAANFQGLEYVNLPQTRSYGAGVRVTF